jgi:integrase
MVKSKGNNDNSNSTTQQIQAKAQTQQHQQHHRHPRGSFSSGSVLSEEQRFELYHEIMEYPTVSRFITKLRRNSKNTARVYRAFLVYFELFLKKKYGDKTTIENVIPKIKSGKEMDVYLLIEDFVSFMLNELGKSKNGARMSVNVVKSLLRSSLITIDSNIVKNTAGVPRTYREAEYPLDKNTVATIIQSCKDRRLKALLFFLASSGARIGEATNIRWRDISFDKSPCEIRLPAQITKTKTARTIYISNEAKNELLNWKHYKEVERKQSTALESPQSLVFQSYVCPNRNENNEINRDYIKMNIAHAFTKLLASINLKTPKKESADINNNNNGENNNGNNGIIKHTRYKITLHSLRAFFKTQCSLVAKEFELSEFLLGHNSTIAQRYFRASPEAVAETYRNKIMETVTFFDFASVDRKIKSLEADRDEIHQLRQQMQKQAAQIEQLQAEKEQDYVAHSVDDYSSEQYIEKQEKIIEHLKTQMHSQNTALIDATKNTKVVADNVLTQTRSEEKIVEMLEKKVDILMKKVEQLTADKQTDKKSS